MKYIILTTLLFLLFSCNNQKENNEYVLFPDSTNYEYKPLKNGLLKVIRFFPGTKDTTVVYFVDKKRKRQDSTAYYFYKSGNIRVTIKFENDNNIKKIKSFYKNGNRKSEFMLRNGHLKGNLKTYYPSGNLRSITEVILYKDSIEHKNNVLIYKESGELNKDSTFFVEMITDKDTIKISDSVKVEFNVIKPANVRAFAFPGSIKDYFESKDLINTHLLTDSIYFFKPCKTGNNLIEIVFLFEHLSDKKHNKGYTDTYLKKEIYVTK